MELEFVEPDFATSLQEAREVESLMKHPGWKHIEGLLKKLSDSSRLKIDSQIINKQGIDPQKLVLMNAFISGQISTADKIIRMLKRKIDFGKNIQNQLTPEPPI